MFSDYILPSSEHISLSFVIVWRYVTSIYIFTNSPMTAIMQKNCIGTTFFNPLCRSSIYVGIPRPSIWHLSGAFGQLLLSNLKRQATAYYQLLLLTHCQSRQFYSSIYQRWPTTSDCSSYTQTYKRQFIT